MRTHRDKLLAANIRSLKESHCSSPPSISGDVGPKSFGGIRGLSLGNVDLDAATLHAISGEWMGSSCEEMRDLVETLEEPDNKWE